MNRVDDGQKDGEGGPTNKRRARLKNNDVVDGEYAKDDEAG
jgi:hypothetical protein